jgi:hypothetical protein
VRLEAEALDLIKRRHQARMEFISRLLWELFLKELLLLAAMVVLRGIRHMAAAVVVQERQERVKTVAKGITLPPDTGYKPDEDDTLI